MDLDAKQIKSAVKAFTETIAVKLKLLRELIPRDADFTNTALTGAFVEEMTRGFVQSWIGDSFLLHGMLVSESEIADATASGSTRPMALQIDGIVYDPKKGPLILREGDFIAVSPDFIRGVIEIKMSEAPSVLSHRLKNIYQRYIDGCVGFPAVMGVIVASKDPEAMARVTGEGLRPWHEIHKAGHHPVFVLFKENDNGTFEPNEPAIYDLVRMIYSRINC